MAFDKIADISEIVRVVKKTKRMCVALAIIAALKSQAAGAGEICNGYYNGKPLYLFANLTITFSGSDNGEVTIDGPEIRPLSGKIGSNAKKVRVAGGGNKAYLIRENGKVFLDMYRPSKLKIELRCKK